MNSILLAENHEHELRVTGDRLTAAGFHVIPAHNGSEALHLAEQTNPDLLIANYTLPNLSAIELCQRLTQRSHTIPTIVLTDPGYSVVFSREIGIQKLLNKPCSTNDLITAARQLLAA